MSKDWENHIGRLRNQISDLRQTLRVIKDSADDRPGLEQTTLQLRELAEKNDARLALFQFPKILQTILTNPQVGAIVYGPSGEHLLFNAAAEKILGSDLMVEAQLGKSGNFGFYLADKTTRCSKEQLPWQQSIQGKPDKEVDLFVRRQGYVDGLWVRITSTTLKNEGKEIGGVVVFLADITEQVQVETQIQSLCEVLEQQVTTIGSAQLELKLLTDKLAKLSWPTSNAAPQMVAIAAAANEPIPTLAEPEPEVDQAPAREAEPTEDQAPAMEVVSEPIVQESSEQSEAEPVIGAALDDLDLDLELNFDDEDEDEDEEEEEENTEQEIEAAEEEEEAGQPENIAALTEAAPAEIKDKATEQKNAIAAALSGMVPPAPKFTPAQAAKDAKADAPENAAAASTSSKDTAAASKQAGGASAKDTAAAKAADMQKPEPAIPQIVADFLKTMPPIPPGKTQPAKAPDKPAVNPFRKEPPAKKSAAEVLVEQMDVELSATSKDENAKDQTLKDETPSETPEASSEEIQQSFEPETAAVGTTAGIAPDEKAAEADANPEPVAQPAAPPVRTKKILIVDDIPVNQKLLRLQLKRLGFECDTANNGDIAQKAIANGDFALVLMDLDMPVMDGFESTIAIRRAEQKTAKHVPIVAMTSYDREEDRDRCLMVGMDDFLSKGATQKQLQEVVERCIQAPPPDPEVIWGEIQAINAQPAHHEIKEGSVLDIASLQKQFGKEEVQDVSRLFLSAVNTFIDCIQLGIEEKDAGAVTHFAHSVKGPCAALGIEEMTRLTSEIMSDAESGNWTQVRVKYMKLKSSFAEVRDELRELCKPEYLLTT